MLSTFEFYSVLYSDDLVVTLEYLTTIAVAIRNAGAKFRDLRAGEFAEEDIHSEALRTETTEVVDSIRVSGLYKRGQVVSLKLPDNQKYPSIFVIG